MASSSGETKTLFSMVCVSQTRHKYMDRPRCPALCTVTACLDEIRLIREHHGVKKPQVSWEDSWWPVEFLATPELGADAQIRVYYRTFSPVASADTGEIVAVLLRV